MASITYTHVWKKYGEVVAVQDLDIFIEDKEFLVFVGPSGCGKSTSLRMLAGLEEISERRPAQGSEHRHGVPKLCSLPTHVGL
jgi:multiple sugar transport system ATP-binding protein